MDLRAVLTERDPFIRLVLIAIARHRRDLEVYDLKHLAVWTANAIRGKAP